ncbi:MAG TPA: N-acetyltransferase [Candidatus Acidoferrales bacterium]
MPLTFGLREYQPRDFEALYAIDQACYQPGIAYSRRDLRNYLRFPGAHCLVAEAGNQAVGFILTAHAGHWGYIITIDVLEAHRRHGVGAMMLREAERALSANGVQQVGLETATNSASAIAFWKKHGYRTQGIRKDYYPGGIDAYSMHKRIAQPEL